MNKWQIICPLVALMILGAIAGVVHGRGQYRYCVLSRTGSIGHDLVRHTNSVYLVRVGPSLQYKLSQLLSSPTSIEQTVMGDEAGPIGDGKACSRLFLRNERGKRLAIRFRQADEKDKFQVVGFWTPPEDKPSTPAINN